MASGCPAKKAFGLVVAARDIGPLLLELASLPLRSGDAPAMISLICESINHIQIVGLAQPISGADGAIVVVNCFSSIDANSQPDLHGMQVTGSLFMGSFINLLLAIQFKATFRSSIFFSFARECSCSSLNCPLFLSP